MPDSTNWTAVGAVAAAVIAQGGAVWMYLRGRKVADGELKLKTDGQEFDQEQRLRVLIEGLVSAREANHNTIHGLQNELLDVRRELQTVRLENEALRRTNEERERDYSARQILTDQMLREALQDRDGLREELAALREMFRAQSRDAN